MRHPTNPRRALLAAALCSALLAAHAAQAADETTSGEQGPTGEWRLQAFERGGSPSGPLALADARRPGIASAATDALVAEAELRHTLQGRLGGHALSLTGDLLARLERPRGDAEHGRARLNELHASADLGAWQLSVGKKVVGWDVGYGFRPNDLVQQEARRTQLGSTPEGRPLLQVERFEAETAQSLVWVNPGHWNAGEADRRGPRESALAWRGYRRAGALDAFGFARWGARTGASLGMALAWVATDELELHGSARALQRHDGWRIDPAAGLVPASVNPWRQATLGGTSQWLLGGQWTGLQQQSVLLEFWHDGSALSDAQWARWNERNAALANGPAPAAVLAGNLAWQASPFDSPSLRRDNLYVRLAWQPEHWLWTLDALIHPADGGRLVTFGAQWQGDQWRLNASWRVAGGPARSLLAQVPVRRSVVLALARAF